MTYLEPRLGNQKVARQAPNRPANPPGGLNLIARTRPQVILLPEHSCAADAWKNPANRSAVYIAHRLAQNGFEFFRSAPARSASAACPSSGLSISQLAIPNRTDG